jgi:monovalent cation:proton antiporter-2 (CPA2) family protein
MTPQTISPIPTHFFSLSIHQKRLVKDALASPDDLPDELAPLAIALAAAEARIAREAATREALEVEAQRVAELAVDARERAARAVKAADKTAAAAAEATADRDAAAEAIRALVAELASLADAAREAGTAAAAAGPGDQSDTVRAAIVAARSTLVEREGAYQVAKAAAAEAAGVAATATAAAGAAEEVAGGAMSAAEGAVRDEMEATAVAKETRIALGKALADLADLTASFTASDGKQKAAAEAAKAAKEPPVESGLAAEAAALAAAAEVAAKAVASSKGAATTAFPTPASSKTPAAGAEELSPAAATAAAASPNGSAPPTPALAAARARLRTRRALTLAAAAAALAAAALALNAAGALEIVAAAAAPALAAARAAGATLARWVPPITIPHGTEGLVETCVLLLTSVIAVPLVCRIPGGSPVLGFLVGGAAIGPHALGIIRDVAGVRHLAELGVVFLLFNIGLELSLERLRSMQKYVFGMGTAQVAASLAAIAWVVSAACGLGGPPAIVLGGGLALSSTAVAMQVLQDRGESGSRHGRATFAVLLLQDLAVVVLLMLIPLLAPSPTGEAAGAAAIGRALGLAAVKAVATIVAIIAGGRVILRPIYRRVADLGNADVFAATTLLVVLGTSVLTQIAGLSLALGAFLAGLLLAETEFALQVESDIAPYKGLLMGLFFMTVGMEISVGLLLNRAQVIAAGIAVLLAGKAAIMAALGPAFGLSRLVAARAGLLLASGGEFAFVAFGEAQAVGLLTPPVVRELFLVVALSMALVPLLAEVGARAGRAFDTTDMRALAPSEDESGSLRGHVIIAGFGRVGQIIAQLLAERLIPFVAVDVRVDRVAAGKALDLPVYFGDAGSPAVLHSLGAGAAACAVITLDTPGANYRSVWALNKHYPNVKTYVRAHDVDHGLNLEKAGATAVVPETLEPSLQLASAVLSQLKLPPEEVQAAISNFRRTHLSELQALAAAGADGERLGGGGGPGAPRVSLGYGYTMDEESGSDSEAEGAGEGGVGVGAPMPA